jgi:hypothetical protein
MFDNWVEKIFRDWKVPMAMTAALVFVALFLSVFLYVRALNQASDIRDSQVETCQTVAAKIENIITTLSERQLRRAEAAIAVSRALRTELRGLSIGPLPPDLIIAMHNSVEAAKAQLADKSIIEDLRDLPPCAERFPAP